MMPVLLLNQYRSQKSVISGSAGTNLVDIAYNFSKTNSKLSLTHKR